MPVRILVVEDDATGRTLLHNQLLHLDPEFEIVDAVSLAEAKRILVGKTDINLIFLDLNLPNSIGLNTIRQIRDRTRLPIIVITSMVDGTMRVRAMSSGVYAWLEKGKFELDELASIITSTMEEHKRSQDVFAGLYSRVDAIYEMASGIDDRVTHIAMKQDRTTQILLGDEADIDDHGLVGDVRKNTSARTLAFWAIGIIATAVLTGFGALILRAIGAK